MLEHRCHMPQFTHRLAIGNGCQLFLQSCPPDVFAYREATGIGITPDPFKIVMADPGLHDFFHESFLTDVAVMHYQRSGKYRDKRSAE